MKNQPQSELSFSEVTLKTPEDYKPPAVLLEEYKRIRTENVEIKR